VAEAVEGDPDHRPGLAVVDQAGGHVGVVVLHALQLDPVQLQGVLGRQVLGVQVVGDHLRLDREQAPEVPDPLGEGAVGLVVLEVADVVGEERVGPLGQAEGVLELGPAGQHVAGERPRQGERLGREPPRAPQGQLAPAEGAHHRVVGPHVDRAVVAKEPVGDPAEPLPGLLVPKAIGSSETFPLVSTIGRPTSASSRWCRGV